MKAYSGVRPGGWTRHMAEGVALFQLEINLAAMRQML